MWPLPGSEETLPLQEGQRPQRAAMQKTQGLMSLICQGDEALVLQCSSNDSESRTAGVVGKHALVQSALCDGGSRLKLFIAIGQSRSRMIDRKVSEHRHPRTVMLPSMRHARLDSWHVPDHQLLRRAQVLHRAAIAGGPELSLHSGAWGWPTHCMAALSPRPPPNTRRAARGCSGDVGVSGDVSARCPDSSVSLLSQRPAALPNESD